MPKIDEMFTTSVIKLARAGEHLAEIEKLLVEYENSKPARVVLKPSYENFINPPKSYIKITTRMAEPPPERIKAVLGDFLHNLRSALDTAVFPLVEDKFDNKRLIQFVISEDEASFRDKFDKKFAPHLNEATISVIKESKPFKGGNALLYALSDLNNIDKHRYHIVASADAGGTITGEQFATLVPPGTYIARFQSIILGGTLIIPMVGEWSEPKKLQDFISDNNSLPIPAKVFLEPPSYEHSEELYYVCHEMKQEVEKLVKKLINANKKDEM